jgi:hypothetical protein
VNIPEEDKRFTFGLVIDAAEVLRKHGYPVPTHGNYDAGDIHREIGQALWRLIYLDTNLGARPALPGQQERGLSPEPPSFDPACRGIGL